MRRNDTLRFAIIATCTIFVACDGSTDPDEPVLHDLSTSLANAATQVEFNRAQAALTDFSGVISQVVATDGFPLACSDCHTGGPSIAPRGPVAGVVARLKGRRAGDRGEGSDLTIVEQTVARLAVPVRENLLGTTCVWNPSADFWGNDPTNPYGDPPADAINFELYESANRRPVIPLDAIGGFATVAPRLQGPTIDVGGGVTLDGVELVSFQADGATSGQGLFDVDVAGRIRGDDDVTYTSELVQSASVTSSATQATVLDISIQELVSVAATGSAGLDLDVDRSGSDPQSLTFDLDFAAPDLLTITQGQVFFGGVAAATVSGSLSNPQITILDGSPIPTDEAGLLLGIFENASIVTGGIFEHVLFGACVGTTDHSVCSLIDPGAPDPPQ
ncbi:MAG: hypothetical protein R3195_09015 [Gemmatimonadota bacterium]|nr:hypothetical protein [Gemmatimonadota bacterium]